MAKYQVMTCPEIQEVAQTFVTANTYDRCGVPLRQGLSNRTKGHR